MSRDERRKGDRRPRRHAHGVPLNLHPTHGEALRWLPRHGDATCVVEWFTQHAIRLLAYLPFYTAVVVTMTLLFVVFGVPFLKGG